jgi:tetratricopeptide (TPR) repeat protein
MRLPRLRIRLFRRRRRLRSLSARRARVRAPRIHRHSKRRLLAHSPWYRFRRCRRLRARRTRHHFDLYGGKNQQIIRAVAVALSLIAMMVVAFVARPARSQTAGTANLLSSPAAWPTSGSPSATTALAQDPTAVFLNPAGLASQDERTLLVQHGILQFETDWDVAAVSYPIPGLGAAGIGVARLGTSGLEAYDAQNQPLGSYGYTETALAASVARRAIGPTYAGVTFKVLSQSLGDVSAAAPALDLGLAWRPAQLRGGQVGFTAENVVAGSLDLGGAASAIDRSFRLGAAAPEWRLGRAGALRAALDVARHGTEGTRMRLGVEYARAGLGALRAGFDHGRPVFGVGIQYRRYAVDLSLVQNEFEMTKQLGIRLAWGEPVSQYESRRRQEYARAAEDSLRARNAVRVAGDRARAQAAEKAGDWETALVLWEVLARDLPGDPSLTGRADAARAAIARRAKEDLEAASRRILADTLAVLAHEALNRGDVEEAAGLTRALGSAGTDSAAAGSDPGADSLALLQRRIGAARDQAADRAVARADSLRAQGKLLQAAGEAALALRLRPADPHATALWTTLEGSFGKSAAEASVLARRLEALTAVHEASLAFNEGRYGDAARAVKRALAADPTSAEARAWRERVDRRLAAPRPELDARIKQLYIQGMEAFAKGDYQEALRSWEQILVLDPLNESARRNVLEARDRMKSEARR